MRELRRAAARVLHTHHHNAQYGLGLIGGWKERYFVLDSFGALRYFENEHAYASSPTANVKSAVHLSSISGMRVVSKLPDTGMPGLILETPEREYRLEGESVDYLTDVSVVARARHCSLRVSHGRSGCMPFDWSARGA